MKAVNQSSEVLNRKLHAKTWAEMATRTFKIGDVVTLRGHTNNGVGGGLLIAVNSAGLTADNGFISVTASAGIYLRRDNPKKTPYEFGFIDGGADVSITANACTVAHGELNLDGGKTYDLQKQLNVIKLRAVGGARATLNLTSPTGNGIWSGPTSEFVNTAAVMCIGAVGSPLEGADVRDINIQCNKMRIFGNGTGVKGFMFVRCRGFKQSSCAVTNCASYAFWDYDVNATGTTYCSGVRDNCWATDSAVSFEQVNCRGIVLTNCHGYLSAAVGPYVPEAIFHAYGGSDMRVVYDNCTGIADGVCPAVFSILNECKNISVRNCKFINNYNAGAAVASAVYFEPAGGNFSGINFDNCELSSSYWAAVIIGPGLLGSVDALINFNDCKISGKSIGVAISGTGGNYTFTNCNSLGTSIGGATAFGLKNEGVSNTVRYLFGRLTATGGPSPQASNLSSSSIYGTIQIPASVQSRVIRQQKIEEETFLNQVDHASVVVAFQWATLPTSKIKVSAMINAAGAVNGAAAAGQAVAISYIILGDQNIRLYAPLAAAGRKVGYEITEYE